MSLALQIERSVDAINKYGFLLVFPIKNQPFPHSLWAELHPQIPMRWEWDDNGDGRVFELWRIREALASSKRVVYGKYYQGRATFFSHQRFQEYLCLRDSHNKQNLSREARGILEILEMDSPLSTKQLKEMSGLRGKMLESLYQKSLKELWQKGLVVGVGEIDDGAFPSLAHAATENYFEDIWRAAAEMDPIETWISWTEMVDFESLESWIAQTEMSQART